MLPCSTQGSCGAGTYQSALCTTTADRVCSTCEVGKYCPGGGIPYACNTSVSCGPGMYETDACDAVAGGGVENRHFTDISSSNRPPPRVVCKYEHSP